MDVFTAMKDRQSIRKFRKEIVPREQILRMVEAASWAPTAGNAQNFRFIVVQDKETLARMRGIVDEVLENMTGKETPEGKPSAHNLFTYAPAAVCVVALPFESATDKVLRVKDADRFKSRRFLANPGIQGVSAVIAQFLLAAHALGYATCWMTAPLIAKPELESTLLVRYPEELVAIVALGKSASSTSKPPRKAPEEFVTFR
jgi:nitroreductase